MTRNLEVIKEREMASMGKIVSEVGRCLPRVDLTSLVPILNLSSILYMESMFHVCNLVNGSACYLPFGCRQHDLIRSFTTLKEALGVHDSTMYATELISFIYQVQKV
jgi:hypothetical protein